MLTYILKNLQLIKIELNAKYGKKCNITALKKERDITFSNCTFLVLISRRKMSLLKIWSTAFAQINIAVDHQSSDLAEITWIQGFVLDSLFDVAQTCSGTSQNDWYNQLDPAKRYSKLVNYPELLTQN